MAPAREANTERTIKITASELHTGVLLLDRAGGEDWFVLRTKRTGNRVLIEVARLSGPPRVYEVGAEREVTIRAEYACDCRGSGTYQWGGSVNGRPVKTGPHFACAEKGYQTPQDVIRNSTYWNKYARIYA